MGTMIMARHIHLNVIVPSASKRLEVTEILPRSSYPRCNLIIDLKCQATETLVLEQVKMEIPFLWEM